jgi:hypothetical protein
MKTDARQDEEEKAESPEHPGLMQRLGHAATERELRVLDGAIGLFQRWRSRIGPPPEDDDRRGGRRAPRDAAPVPPAPAIDAGKHHRLRGFLIMVAMLLAAGVSAMLFSYSLLSRVIQAEDLIIDDLRDQLTQMEKADARNLAIQAKEQNRIAEDRKALREYQAKIGDYEEQMAALRAQIAALTPPPPRREAVATAGPRRPPSRAAAQKTGNCVATGSNAASDLSRCVDSFNKP